MNICILADDLTGASDSGVQFTKFGVRPTVALNHLRIDELLDREVLVIDTDSRAMSPEAACRTVSQLSQQLQKTSPEIVYKKIDSLLRGNIGAEFEAIFSVFQPDCLIVTPGYPENGRVVKNGELYVNGVALEKTGIINQHGERFQTSNIAEIIAGQSERNVQHLTAEEVMSENIKNRLDSLIKENVSILTLDCKDDFQLQRQINQLNNLDQKIIWAGSAGLAQHLWNKQGTEEFSCAKNSLSSQTHNLSAIFVIGSMSPISIKQRERLIRSGAVTHYTFDPNIFFESEWEHSPVIDNILTEVERGKPKNVLLYPSADDESLNRVKQNAKDHHKTMGEAMKYISDCIGILVNKVFSCHEYEAIVLTGGDIAKSVCTSLESTEFELLSQLEAGIPVGKLHGKYDLIGITKAGSFGNENTLLNALHYLKGGSANV